jgi:hypothetical protein
MRLLSIVFIMNVIFCVGQNDTLVLNGIYQGKNISVQNPFVKLKSGDYGYSIQKILVNRKQIFFEGKGKFIIHLDSLRLKKGSNVRLEIYYREECVPGIISGLADSRFSLDLLSLHVDSIGVVRWKVKPENTLEHFIVEQFRWNRWIEVGELNGKDNMKENEYYYQTLSHSGENLFRVKQQTLKGKYQISQTVIFSSNVKKIQMLHHHIKPLSFLEFDGETMYEIYDAYGTLLKKGTGTKVDCSDLKKRSYYINFDNEMGEFLIY